LKRNVTISYFKNIVIEVRPNLMPPAADKKKLDSSVDFLEVYYDEMLELQI
jgi:hypothetical protein